VCKYLETPVHQSLKTLLFTAKYKAKEVHYMIMLLGDDELNEVKLKNFLKADEIDVAKADVLAELNVPKGFMSPLGLNGKVNVVIDSSIDRDSSYIVGANEVDHHVKGFSPSRDIENFRIGDLRLAKEGDLTSDGNEVSFRRGIEVGHIFQLGDKYTKSMNSTVLDQNGKKINPLMGCYGIGVTRTMASAIEQSHDEDGIIWPKAIAPFSVYFAKIGKKEETQKLCEEIYQDLKASDIEVLYDDRGMGPGPMFKDADLLGLPIRVILGERDYEKDFTLEVKTRKTKKVLKVKKEELVKTIKELLSEID